MINLLTGNGETCSPLANYCCWNKPTTLLQTQQIIKVAYNGFNHCPDAQPLFSTSPLSLCGILTLIQDG